MAEEEGDTTFVSKLNEKSKEKCKKELNELNDKDRAIAVQTLRKWVHDQDWLKTPTDFTFLLRFLRARKFSQLEARQNLENYWACKEKMPTMYKNIDPADPKLQKLIKLGFCYSHKEVDEEGRRFYFVRPAIPPGDKVKEIGPHNIYKVLILVMEWVMFDENAQVNGMRMVGDYSHVSWQTWLAHANVDDHKCLMKFAQKALPIRLKGLYMYNEPQFVSIIIAFFNPFMSQKFKDRLTIVGNNLVELYKDVSKSVLPNEYLPDEYTGPRVGSIDKVVDDMIEDMMKPAFRNYICDVSSSKYGIDRAKRADTEAEPAASFRKLNVD